MVNPQSIPDHVTQIREEARSRGLTIDGIAINETIGPEEQHSPGAAIVYLANLDRAGVLGACKACWDDGDGTQNCFNQTLDGLLTNPDRKPRSIWWAYRAYAQLIGDMVKLTPVAKADGQAVLNVDNHRIDVVIGATVNGDLALDFTGASAITGIDLGKPLGLKVFQLTNSNTAESGGATEVSRDELGVDGGIFSVVLNAVKSGEVRTIQLSYDTLPGAEAGARPEGGTSAEGTSGRSSVGGAGSDHGGSSPSSGGAEGDSEPGRALLDASEAMRSEENGRADPKSCACGLSRRNATPLASLPLVLLGLLGFTRRRAAHPLHLFGALKAERLLQNADRRSTGPCRP